MNNQSTVDEITAFIDATWPHLECQYCSHDGKGEFHQWAILAPPLLQIEVALEPVVGVTVKVGSHPDLCQPPITLARSPLGVGISWDTAIDSVLPAIHQTAANLMPAYNTPAAGRFPSVHTDSSVAE